MRIAADLGVFGLSLFLLVVGVAAWRAFRSPNRWAWLSVLVIYCGIMITTNILDSYYISHTFWMLIAMIDSQYTSAAVGAAGMEWIPPVPSRAIIPFREQSLL
jgi:hypothetical protein